MRPSVIARQYMRGWFWFDAFIVVVDWGFTMGLQESDAVGIFRFGKSVRVARILRAVRLLRFVKLQRVLTEALNLINSEAIRAFFNVTLAVAFIITINHYMACCWYFIGKSSNDRGVPNWIENHDML